MLASNPAVSPVTQWPIGCRWAELSHAYEVFKDAGHDVTFASPNGGEIHADGYSDPEDEGGALSGLAGLWANSDGAIGL